MATDIHHVMAVNIQAITSATAEAARTFTTTRALRVFDCKGYKDTIAPVGVACALTVSNGANPITTMTTPNPPVPNTIYRLGQEIAASTCDDAQMLIAAGGTMVFGIGTADSFDLTAFCITE